MNQDRKKTIIKYNVAGIFMNLLLTVAKLIVGISIHSDAVMLDAVNGLSDMLSSVLS